MQICFAMQFSFCWDCLIFTIKIDYNVNSMKIPANPDALKMITWALKRNLFLISFTSEEILWTDLDKKQIGVNTQKFHVLHTQFVSSYHLRLWFSKCFCGIIQFSSVKFKLLKLSLFNSKHLLIYFITNKCLSRADVDFRVKRKISEISWWTVKKYFVTTYLTVKIQNTSWVSKSVNP